MGEVHRLILQHGADGARALVETRAARKTIDAAAAILADEETRLGITHAGFAMTSLPIVGLKTLFGQGKEDAQNSSWSLVAMAMAAGLECPTAASLG